MAKDKRLKMKDWLLTVLESGQDVGISWISRAAGTFRIRWKHGSHAEYQSSKDSALFFMWAKHTGRIKPKDPKRWKANFRCALQSIKKDVVYVKNATQSRGSQAYRVYKFASSPNPKTSNRPSSRTELKSTLCSESPTSVPSLSSLKYKKKNHFDKLKTRKHLDLGNDSESDECYFSDGSDDGSTCSRETPQRLQTSKRDDDLKEERLHMETEMDIYIESLQTDKIPKSVTNDQIVNDIHFGGDQIVTTQTDDFIESAFQLKKEICTKFCSGYTVIYRLNFPSEISDDLLPFPTLADIFPKIAAIESNQPDEYASTTCVLKMDPPGNTQTDHHVDIYFLQNKE